MLWACQKLQAAETWPSGKTSENFIDRFESFEVEKSRLQALLNKDRVITPWDDMWWNLILDYTCSNLSRISDRLIALQGLTSQIETSTGRRYCASLWVDQTLPVSLLWTALSPKLPRTADYRAPTWSWASIYGPIQQDTKQLISGTIVVDVLGTIDLSNNHQTSSRVPMSALRISGGLLPGLLTSYEDGTAERLTLSKTQSKEEQARLEAERRARLDIERQARLDEEQANLDLEQAKSRQNLWFRVVFSAKNQLTKGKKWSQRHAWSRCIWDWFQCFIVILAYAILALFYLLKTPCCIGGCLIRLCFPPFDYKFKWWFEIHQIRMTEVIPEMDLDTRWESASLREARKPVATQNDEPVECFCDCPRVSAKTVEVLCLPILRERYSSNFHGLILGLVEGETDCYERLGVFKTFESRKATSLESSENRILL